MTAAAGLAFTATPTGAQSIDELNAQITDAQSQAQALGAEIESQTAELAAAQQEAAAAAAHEAELSAALAKGEKRAAELAKRVQVAKKELRESRARLERALDALADRLVAIYKADAPDATTVLLESDGFDDFATRAELLGRIQSADAGLAHRVRALHEEVADRVNALRRAYAEQKAFNERVAATRERVAKLRADAEAAAAALAQARAAQAAAMASLQSQVAGWTGQVQQLQQIPAASAQQEVASWVGEWAIPQAIVMCESGGNYNAVNPSSGAGGAYQIMPSTWQAYGGEGSPQDASREEQDQVAAQIWADSGSGAWECAQ